jgi:dienelactone hydrolase
VRLPIIERLKRKGPGMRMILRALTAAALFAGAVLPCTAAPFIQEEIRIPLASAGSAGLEALLVRPSEPGQYPLALINHGSPRTGADRPNMTPLSMLPEAMEFARRGWAAVVVMRRGYGGSGGGWAEIYGGCANPNYLAAASAAAGDLRAAISFLAKRPDIDGSRMISVGVSAGGFATVALTADAPRGLVAAISFAGGRGSLQSDAVCREDRLVGTFRALGQRSRVPMLWVYAENDHFFGPVLAEKLREAFTAGGGIVEFIRAPAFGTDGHTLFSPAGVPKWSGYVDAFLRRQNLVLRETPLPEPRPALEAPAALSANGRKAFDDYLISAPHKAFALARDGSFGWRSGARTAEAASANALKSCLQHAKSCGVVFVDDAAAAK